MVAGLHKLRKPAYYRELLSSWLPPGMPGVASLVYLVAVVEGVIALMLIIPAGHAVGLMCSATLLVVYAMFMAMQLVQGRRNLQCGCAGPLSDLIISPALLIRNLLCAALALLALVPNVSVAAGFGSAGLSLSIAVFLVTVYLTTEQMIANTQRLTGES